MLDPVEFGKAMGMIVRDATAPLLKRIEALESRQLERGEKGEPGASVTVDDVAPMLSEMVARAVAEIPPAERGEPGAKGEDGRDGTSVTAADIAPLIADSIAKAVADIPTPKDGADGKDADPVVVADVVAELIESKHLEPILDLCATEAVAKHFDANPVQHGKDGAPGRDGKDGERGPIGERGEKGLDGKDGRDGLDVKDLFRADGGRLVAVLSDGSTKDLGEFVGKDGRDGADGKDGADGLAFDKVSGDMDPDRGYVLRFEQGERTKELVLPYMRHIGFWREGMGAKGGNTTTHNGNLWIALRDTKATPCIENKEDWALAARKGRDGDKGDAGKDYKPPEPVKLGKRDA